MASDSSYPLVTIEHNKAITTSLTLANVFDKKHFHILRSIKSLIKKGCTKEFYQSNFGFIEYSDLNQQKRPMFQITRDGFTILVMSFTGKKAMEWKLKYIQAFNDMEYRLQKKQEFHVGYVTGKRFDLGVTRFKKAMEAAELVGLKNKRKARIFANQITLDTTGVNLMSCFGLHAQMIHKVQSNPIHNEI